MATSTVLDTEAQDPLWSLRSRSGGVLCLGHVQFCCDFHTTVLISVLVAQFTSPEAANVCSFPVHVVLCCLHPSYSKTGQGILRAILHFPNGKDGVLPRVFTGHLCFSF